MSDHSTRKPRPRKAGNRPKKPYPTFPLTPHASGKWMKKIRNKIHYFGAWAKRVNGQMVRVEGDGWKEALELYKAHADDLHAGRTPRVHGEGLTLADLCNRFLTAKQRQYEAGEISARMYNPGATPEQASGEYKQSTDRLIAAFGKDRLVVDLAADDFEALRHQLAKQFGPVRLGNEIQKIRTIFKYGFESGLIETPVRYGPQFKKPSASVMRRHRAKTGERMLEAEQIRKLLAKAGPQVKAMLLLGVNAGFGNHDIATLPLSALDLDAGWVDYPRPKTGISRRCPLWRETVEALRQAIAERPEPRAKEAMDLVFVTSRGRPWLVNGIANPISVAMRDLMKAVSIHGRGIGFYVLRHTFRTVADAAKDPVAVDLIMGHSDPSMGAHYRERIDDSRLQAVAVFVHEWLFIKPVKGTEADSRGEVKTVPFEATKSEQPTKNRPRLRLFAG